MEQTRVEPCARPGLQQRIDDLVVGPTRIEGDESGDRMSVPGDDNGLALTGALQQSRETGRCIVVAHGGHVFVTSRRAV